MQSVSMENIMNTYSIANELKFDVTDAIEEHRLDKQFVAWNCKGCCKVPLTDSVNYPIYQQLPK